MRLIFTLILVLTIAVPAFCEAPARSSTELVRLAWQASNKGDLPTVDALTQEMLKAYGTKAKALAASLKNFPPRNTIQQYQIMEDVATILFVRAEAMMHAGKDQEATALFNSLIADYPWAQTFDPSRGSYWSVAEKSQDSIDVMRGKMPNAPIIKPVPKTVPTLAFPGKDKVVDFQKYGRFLNAGTKDYHYQLTDRTGLAAAEGEGIYPNIADVYKDPNYKKLLKEGRLKGERWDFVNSQDLQAAFYKWATADEDPGTKLFYIGLIFEKAGMYLHAIKAYQALIAHFPHTVAWTYWHTPWYPAQAAVAKIKYITRMHQQLHLDYRSGKIRILNSYDNDPSNDVTITSPGAIRVLGPHEMAQAGAAKVPLGKPLKYSGTGWVRFVKYDSGSWQLLVNNKPFLIKGISYMPSKVGQSPDKGTLVDWMQEDDNHDGTIDAPYESWVDKNGNNKQDPDEPTVGDFQLMKDMGVNTLRIYYQTGMDKDKAFLENMYRQYGFRVAMSNFLGKYAIGSGASWTDGTDYGDPQQQKNMMAYVRQMVMAFKDEPYILMWILGNENNYGVASNANKKPDAYYKFVNKVALMIKSIDPNHPVAICNGDTLFLDKFAKDAPDVDAYGANVYRGNYGFGSFWDDVATLTDKPAFITEYGAPSYAQTMTYAQSQQAQADYHQGNWLDILDNSAGYADGSGNSVGGFAFEWLDEWWKNYQPATHDTKADTIGPFPGGYYFEEWFGLFGQGDGSQSPYLREPRKVYYTYKKLWNA